MKRMFTTTAALAAIAGLAACQGAVPPIKLVPDQATMIAGVDVKGLMSSALYTANKDQLEKDQEALAMLGAAKECNLDPEKMNEVVIGLEPAGKNAVAIISGAGIGKEENINCIGGKIKEKQGKDPWALDDRDGKKVLNMDGGEAIGYLVNDNTIAVVSKGWIANVKQLIDLLRQIAAVAPVTRTRAAATAAADATRRGVVAVSGTVEVA